MWRSIGDSDKEDSSLVECGGVKKKCPQGNQGPRRVGESVSELPEEVAEHL